MILLTGTDDKLEIVTSGTAPIDVQASYVDLATTTVTPGYKNTAITTATTTDITGSPAAVTQRNVKHVSIRNKDASASNTITVRHNDGATTVELHKFALLAGYTFIIPETGEPLLLDANGSRVQGATPGRLLRQTVLTSASGTHTTGTDTNKIRIRGVGGGGAGGGCTSVASAAGAGGGGGAGAYAERDFTATPNTGYSYTCGAAGVGASGAVGGNGGNSTFVVGGTTVTAPGGTGGTLGTAATTLTARAGGAGGTTPTNGDVNIPGQPGGVGFTLVIATPIGYGGQGAPSQLGPGANGVTAAGNGAAPVAGFGGGGSGALTGASAVRTGGNGAAGCWIVEEYA